MKFVSPMPGFAQQLVQFVYLYIRIYQKKKYFWYHHFQVQAFAFDGGNRFGISETYSKYNLSYLT